MAGKRRFTAKKSKNSGPPAPTWRKGCFQCFACQDADIGLVGYEMFIHKTLGVSMCDSCNTQHQTEDGWHTGDDWEARDDNKKQQFCEICAEGGVLLPCDACEFSYCTKCLKNWLGESEANALIEDEEIEFKCFVCMKDDEKLAEKFPIFSKFLKCTKRYIEEQERVRAASSKVDMLEDLKTNKRVKQFNCFSCGEMCKFSKGDGIMCHPDFKTACCSECYALITADDWSFDADGKSEYCVVSGHCADGENDEPDDLYLCDKSDCKNAFSGKILKLWLGEKEFKILEDDEDAEFICFGCDSTKGKYAEFLKMTKMFFQAFEADADFMPQINDKRREKRKAEKKAKREAAAAKKGRRSGRKRAAQVSEEESEEETITARETRGLKTSFAEDSTDEESDPEIDYTNPNPETKKEPPTEAEAIEYLKQRLESGVASRYKNSKAFKNLLKSLK